MKIQLTAMLISLLLLSCNNRRKTNQVQTGNASPDTGVARKAEANNSTVENTMVPADTAAVGSPEAISEDQLNKAEVSMKDSLIWLAANMRLDHRIFGYEKPDTNSKKMILLSIFTSDVKGNPYHCPYGSFYETNEMDGLQLKFVSDGDKFIEVKVKKEEAVLGRVFIDKKWIDFE
ncbi:hypothetical protein SAMN05421820_102377 [Pedobacter steynii]|uniref:Lipoprotein n=1 Tax=Pedobacter steynii TaxID=430522 RepID=A0A1G9NMX2_9SPHI|nr:hypothetical protein [Pedobacter steynii]NQX39252.1 hypothetical protein [Pedobacter steynii]SDL87643.1 hypothetical protein SAMN05421820_102377 [Pedobacter steynii]